MPDSTREKAIGAPRIVNVTIPYEPRPIFQPFHETTKRWSVIVAHRRAGKTVACVNRLIKSALICPKPEPRTAYVAPQYNQAKDVAWNYLKRFTAPLPGVEINESELRVDLPNGGRVRLYGADNYDRLRGGYFDDVVLDEYADMDPRAWTEVIRPALSDREGSAAFIGTPKGHNAFYELCYGTPDGEWLGASKDADWFFAIHRASETGILSAEELNDARKIMSEEQFEQEFECSFSAALVGAYYGKLMETAEREGRITSVPHDSSLKVETWWDLGVTDAQAIWFAQRQPGGGIHLIDYYENSGEALEHYGALLAEYGKPRSQGGRGYLYSDTVLPHDAKHKNNQTNKSYAEAMGKLGFNVSVVPNHSVQNGIEEVRKLLPRCWFDQKNCARGIEALKQYQKEWDGERRVFGKHPLHDWASHGSDAFRYGAMHKPVRAAANFWTRDRVRDRPRVAIA